MTRHSRITTVHRNRRSTKTELAQESVSGDTLDRLGLIWFVFWLDIDGGATTFSNDHHSRSPIQPQSPQAEEILERWPESSGHSNPAGARRVSYPPERTDKISRRGAIPESEARYRALDGQIPP